MENTSDEREKKPDCLVASCSFFDRAVCGTQITFHNTSMRLHIPGVNEHRPKWLMKNEAGTADRQSWPLRVSAYDKSVTESHGYHYLHERNQPAAAQLCEENLGCTSTDLLCFEHLYRCDLHARLNHTFLTLPAIVPHQ
jgi:hypothetical protein